MQRAKLRAKEEEIYLLAFIFHVFLFQYYLLPSAYLFYAFEAKLFTNLGKLSLVKGIARSVSISLPKLPNQ